MHYKFATEQQDYSDFSSGRVFYSLPGHPAFPVRLASEIFQRCLAHREAIYHTSKPCVLYDPCCGAAYHLGVLGYLHAEHIREVIASDVEAKAVALAKRNLGLLHKDGLDQRLNELSELFEQYGKESHREALKSASVLKARLAAFDHPLVTNVFQANATDNREIAKQIERRGVDVVFTDVPYGRHSQWHSPDQDDFPNPLKAMLDALLHVLSASSIVAVASDKGQKALHERYQRIEHFQVGKRRVTILRPMQGEPN